MKAIQDLRVGDQVGELELPPISRLTLALYCGASNDHMPDHVDIDVARAHGFDDVFAHGMLSMAYLGRLLVKHFPQERLRSFKCQFLRIVYVGDVLTCTGTVAELFEQDGEPCARINLIATDQKGEKKVSGEAVVS